jgi:hypothetical protein
MDYYNKVYLPRLNRFGSNIQERIQGKKEHDFQLFKKKSPNKVTILFEEQETTGVLQIQESSEKEVFSYLLTDIDFSLNDGDIINTIRFVDHKQQTWIIFHLDTYTSIGYNRYQLVELDRTIEWIEDGTVYRQLCHITGSGANLRDKSITEKFMIQWESAVYLPNKILALVMKTFPSFKKGTRILVEGEMWKVTGIDKLSVPGVSYVTLKEDYLDKMTDVVYADAQQLENWSIQSSLGNTIKLKLNSPTSIVFETYYKNEEREEEVIIEIGNNLVYSTGNIMGTSLGATYIKVSLKNAPEVQKIFPIEVLNTQTENMAIVIGPDKLRELDEAFYNLSDNTITIAEVSSEYNKITIKKLENESVKVIGKEMGKDILKIVDTNGKIYTKPINVVSIWLEG